MAAVDKIPQHLLQPPARVKSVQLDGVALLKIIKHCRENLPSIVTGQLLGLDLEERLEVTNSFAFPLPSEDGDDDTDSFQIDMMKNLRTVNVDHNSVGWYTSAFLGSYLSDDLVEAQYEYQKNIPNSIVLVFDPLRTNGGKLFLKAYRLSDKFFKFYSQGQFTHKNFSKAGMSYQDIFEELPIKVHNSHLIHAYLFELKESKTMSTEADRLQLGNQLLMTKHAQEMGTCIDEFAQEQTKFAYYLKNVQKQMQQQQYYISKKKAENASRRANGEEEIEEDLTQNPLFKPIPAPSRMERFLLCNQLQHYVQQIGTNANLGYYKLEAVGSLNKE